MRATQPEQVERWRWRQVALAMLTAALVVIGSAPSQAQTAGDDDRLPRAKLDRFLQAIADRNEATEVRVIIRAKPGEVATLRKAVEDLEHEILGALASSEALIAMVPGNRLLELAAERSVAGISSDRPVRPGRKTNPLPEGATLQVAIVAVPGRIADVARPQPANASLVR